MRRRRSSQRDRSTQPRLDPARVSRRATRHRLAGLAVALLLLGLLAVDLPQRDTDVAVYAKAAERLTASEDPYPRRPGDVLPFTYPPTALPMLYLAAPLTPEQLADTLFVLNLILTLLVMVLVVGDLAREDPSGRLFFWGPIYIASFGGLYLTLQFGQINLLLLLLLWGYWRAVRRGRQHAAAGAMLALGCIAKPHYVLLGLGAGPRPALRIVAGALTAGAVLIALSLWIAPDGSWDSWWREIVATTGVTDLPPGHSSIAAPWNRSIPGAVARFLVPNKFSNTLADDPRLAAQLSTAAIVAVLAITSAVVWRSMRRALKPASTLARNPRGARDHDLELSLISLAVFLIAPASWTHHLVMLLPAALVLLRDRVLAAEVALSSRLTAGLVLAVLALTLDDLLPLAQRVSSLPLMTLMTVGVIALWLLLAEQLWRRSAPLATQETRPR